MLELSCGKFPAFREPAEGRLTLHMGIAGPHEVAGTEIRDQILAPNLHDGCPEAHLLRPLQRVISPGVIGYGGHRCCAGMDSLAW